MHEFYNAIKMLMVVLKGNKYIVTWALGHLVTLADPEKYDKHYQKWDLNDLPIMPEKNAISSYW